MQQSRWRQFSGRSFRALRDMFLGERLYYDPAKTIRAARRAGRSVPDYVELLSNAVGDTDRVIAELQLAGALVPCERVCEIGAGAGRYLDRLLPLCRPTIYEVYEISRGWSRHLERQYGPAVNARPVDGETLAASANASCGLVAAFGVFIYIAPLKSLSYLREMARVLAPGGHLAFDFYPAEAQSVTDIFDRWLPSPHRFAQWLPEQVVLETLRREGCAVVHRRQLDFVWSRPTLLVARKGESR